MIGIWYKVVELCCEATIGYNFTPARGRRSAQAAAGTDSAAGPRCAGRGAGGGARGRGWAPALAAAAAGPPLAPGRRSGSVACTAAHPLHTRFTNRIGTSISKVAMRPNPSWRPVARAAADPAWAGGVAGRRPGRLHRRALPLPPGRGPPPPGRRPTPMVISDYHFTVQLNRFIPGSLSYSVASFSKVSIGFIPTHAQPSHGLAHPRPSLAAARTVTW
jgi:hypothetical protein